MEELKCFKAYDVRGKVPEDLSNELAYDIARAFASELKPKKVVVGYDIREESPEMAAHVRQGLLDMGVDVLDIGLCGTEEVYFATFHHELDGGIMVTASHNPKGYNGLKMVREGSKPISGDTGLLAIKDRVQEQRFEENSTSGSLISDHRKESYINHMLSYIAISNLKPLKVVMNPGNGSAGAVIEELVSHLPFEVHFVHLQPDGTFPNGVPNPLLMENRESTAKAVLEQGADLGIAWDGDFDRCFFFDSQGQFIEGYYVVGLLAQMLLERQPNAKIIHDPRLTWNTIDIVESMGGIPIQSKTGHAFIKERMRKEGAIYGGEMSAHHYFQSFAYCDSGMIPWLLVTELISLTGISLQDMVKNRMSQFPCSGEINYHVSDIPKAVQSVLCHFEGEYLDVDQTDGLSLTFENWRLNIRASNTEPLLRLNIESKGDSDLVDLKLALIESLIL